MARRRPQYLQRKRDSAAKHIKKFRRQLAAGDCAAAVNTYHWMIHDGHIHHLRSGGVGRAGTYTRMRDALKRQCNVPHLRGR